MSEEKAAYLLALLSVLSSSEILMNYGYLKIELIKNTLDELLSLDGLSALRRIKGSIVINFLIVLSYVFRKNIEVI